LATAAAMSLNIGQELLSRGHGASLHWAGALPDSQSPGNSQGRAVIGTVCPNASIVYWSKLLIHENFRLMWPYLSTEWPMPIGDRPQCAPIEKCLISLMKMVGAQGIEPWTSPVPRSPAAAVTTTIKRHGTSTMVTFTSARLGNALAYLSIKTNGNGHAARVARNCRAKFRRPSCVASVV
jgi:hypothetical protein